MVNLRLAEAAGLPAIVVGDIDPGGVFASLYGTLGVLPESLAACVRAFLINKLRGDPALLLDGTDQLKALTGIPTLGVIPMLESLRLDAEDSLALDRLPEADGTESLDVAVIRLPRISNFTDLDALALEEDVDVRFVRSARELGVPDLVVIPGSKATVDDLRWMRERGFDRALDRLPASTTVVGICGGYQMLGRHIDDDVESRVGGVPGLGALGVSTTFDADKVLTCRTGEALGERVVGYQIHHGRVRADRDGEDAPWLTLDGEPEGYRHGSVFGTTLHGVFDEDAFRHAFLREVADRAGTTFTAGASTPAAHREAELDRLADHLAASIDLPALYQLIGEAR
ncbi:MAG: cobyric acid synthase [Actinomycetota bacterium]